MSRITARLQRTALNNTLRLHRKVINDIGERLAVKQLDEWYNVKTVQVVAEGGTSVVVGHYNSSISTCLRHVYPNHEWDYKLFNHVPRMYWRDIENQKAVFDKVAINLGIKVLQDWYSLSTADVKPFGADSILWSKYEGSLSKCLMTLYPNFSWFPWRFKHAPVNYWCDLKNQRLLLEDIAKQLNIKSIDDWYTKGNKDVLHLGAAGVLKHHQYSLSNCLVAVYNDYSWNRMLFGKLPRRFWERPEHRQGFLEKVRNELCINEPSQWYRIPNMYLKANGAEGLLSYWPHTLSLVEPRFDWHW
eukprot:CAMPEP_0168510168 /NCGR_PEP_ID=MMETSP0405-20121227/1269_1 /TAXON_ID=498012 /ORGANISM="Trichosphaerium sp, Strain Am-I-7 wt" /LENGTH=301 /DNA_ID=CAMNT_0008527883 /DNA_START=1 /DNA_END=903 /DNA_ORIENTATION=-